MKRNLFAGLHSDEVYLDWTGAALPPAELIDAGARYLKHGLLGNPHSPHRPSRRAMDDIQATRSIILKYFDANPNEYEVIFTSGATAAIRIMEHFNFQGGELLLTADNHNSVHGLRETAKRQGAVVRYAPITDDLRLDRPALLRMLSYPRSNGNRLFAYPAKSNYTGHLHDLDLVRGARERRWYVLLDAAAFVSNNKLSLCQVKPDFVPVSFYKMFGFPTGVGCLLVRKDAYCALSKKWFAGGSIITVSVARDFYAPSSLGYARYEDGTLNFAMIPLIQNGLQWLLKHGTNRGPLARRLANQLRNGLLLNPRVRVYSGPDSDTVAFSILDQAGNPQHPWVFEGLANEHSVYVRSGGFCNPGVNEKVFKTDFGAFEAEYNDSIKAQPLSPEKMLEYTGGKAFGAIRASFGYGNTDSDVTRLLDVVREVTA